MKCDECKKELNQESVAYYRGKKVHPECFDKLKGESENKARKTWLDELYNKIKRTR